MMHRVSGIVFLALGWLGDATMLTSMESQTSTLPSGWAAAGETARDQLIDLTFAIKQRGLVELHDTLMRVSTPSSPDYGHHLSNDEVQALTAPAPAHIQTVLSFLASHGAELLTKTPNSDFIIARVSVATAEKMLAAKYFQVAHAESGNVVSRALGGYSLPQDVASVVDFVAPTVHLPGVHRPTIAPTVDATQGNASALGFNSPKNLRKLYNVGTFEGKAPGNKQAVTAFLNQRYGSPSLHHFWKQFCDGITCGKGEPKLVGDATTAKIISGTEAMLDIETITGLAGNVESEFWGFGGKSTDNPANEPFMKWLVQMSNTSDADVPKLFSTSYGEDESSWSYPAAQRLNVEFQKAGVRGISLLFASGDTGANCKGKKFVPLGPSSSPYVTSVGGTSSLDAWPAPGPASEAAIGLGAGGFSNYWPMPDYQKSAVAAYLKQQGLPPSSSGYNTSNRAYPDISAQAAMFFVWAGYPQPGVMGTSCAAPTAAAIFSLVNDVRMQAGGKPLGFLNPFIYENAASFNDITKGSNEGGQCGQGWPAKQGWDAATGVGTPDFAKLSKAAMATAKVSEPVVVV